MSASQKSGRRDKVMKGDDSKTVQKQLTLDASLAQNDNGTEMLMLAELRKFREESGNAQRDMMESQTRMEASIGEIKKRIDTLEERLTTAETRVSSCEDRGTRQERALAYLLQKEAKLTAKQDELENRMRRNNIRLYGIDEDLEGREMIPFVIDFFKETLKLPEDTAIRIERAHRAVNPKPKPTAPPRSIIVRFLDFNMKQVVLKQAWEQRIVMFKGKRVYFDQDYSPEVQRKRKQVREVIKKLKERNIKAQSPYPAQLKVFLETGVKTFPSLVEAQLTLRDLGVLVEVEERDILERELLQDRWQTQDRRDRNGQKLTPREIRAIINSVDQSEDV